MTTPRACPTAQIRVRVGAEVEVLERDRARSAAHARVDRGEPGARAPRARRSRSRRRRAPRAGCPGGRRRRSPCWRYRDRCRGRPLRRSAAPSPRHQRAPGRATRVLAALRSHNDMLNAARAHSARPLATLWCTSSLLYRCPGCASVSSTSRPIPEGSTGARRAAQHARPRAARDALGYHRYWLAEHHGADARRAAPEVLIGAGRGRDARDPRRQRRRDAAALQPAQGGRDVQPARRPVPGPDRPRPRPRRGHRPADDARAPARPPPGRARRLPAAARRAARPTSTARCPADHPFARLRSRSPAGPSAPSCGCSARRRRARSGRPSSACPTRSPTSSTRRGADRARLRASGRARPRHAPARSSPPGCSSPRPTRRPSGWRASRAAMTLHLLRQGRLIPVPPPEKALRYLCSRPAGDRRGPAAARSSARPDEVREPASRRSRATTAPTR